MLMRLPYIRTLHALITPRIYTTFTLVTYFDRHTVWCTFRQGAQSHTNQKQQFERHIFFSRAYEQKDGTFDCQVQYRNSASSTTTRRLKSPNSQFYKLYECLQFSRWIDQLWIDHI